MRPNTRDNFWENVDKSGDCWEWKKAKDPIGRGIYSLNGKKQLAHRLAYIFTYGDISELTIVHHKCKNPSCVRPSHLFVSVTSKREKIKRSKSTPSRLTHGMKGTPEYVSWKCMIQRCLNPNQKSYHNYGGRGITVCDKWRNSFEAFYADMGPRLQGRTLDRINTNGNYEPGNCRWATIEEQNNNQRAKRPRKQKRD